MANCWADGKKVRELGQNNRLIRVRWAKIFSRPFEERRWQSTTLHSLSHTLCDQQLEYPLHQVLVTMDRPKLEVSWLECFPPDIWAYIVCYLPGEQIGRLMMTGATLLWQRLKSHHVVKSINLGKDFWIFNTLPQFLKDLPSLHELLIHSYSDEWSQKAGLILESIPSGVRKLELGGFWACSYPHLFGESSNLSQLLPHLTTLDIMGLHASDCSWMINSPQSLTSLKLGEWDGSVALPSSLIHFKANDVNLSTSSFVSTLPQSLESFVAQYEFYGVDLLVPLLPPSTRKLAIGLAAYFEIDLHTLLEQLPTFLTCFVVALGVRIETNPELISLLPMTLTELDLRPAFPCSAWHLLPPNLTRLIFHDLNPKVISVKADGVQRKFDYVPFDLLPRSLTRLEWGIWSTRKHPRVYLCELPATSVQPFFPTNLTRLGLLREFHLSPQVAKLLPSSLTYLEIGNLCEQVCEYLPTGLKTLIARRTLMSPSLIKFLPKSLTLLELYLCNSSDRWFDYNTGKADSISKLPEYSIHEKSLSFNLNWKDFSQLPSTLIKLRVNESNELGDSFLQHQKLPNLLELCIGQSECFTDLSIPMLPRHLTSLELQSSSLVSGKSFEFLPRSLIFLNLNSSESIFDSDIRHLPRTLTHLYLIRAIHLTDLCIDDLPPHLKVLMMTDNSQITPSSFPRFPYALRSPALYNAVWFKHWVTTRGNINEVKQY